MSVYAKFEYNGIERVRKLPLTQDELLAVGEELGVSYRNRTILWDNQSSVLPGVNIEYGVDGLERHYIHIYQEIKVMIQDFIEVNLACTALEGLDDNDYDVIDTCLEYVRCDDVYEFINFISAYVNDYFPYGGRINGDEPIKVTYAKEYYGDRFPEEFWEYVDFYQLGEDDDEMLFGESCYINVYDLDEVNL